MYGMSPTMQLQQALGNRAMQGSQDSGMGMPQQGPPQGQFGGLKPPRMQASGGAVESPTSGGAPQITNMNFNPPTPPTPPPAVNFNMPPVQLPPSPPGGGGFGGSGFTPPPAPPPKPPPQWTPPQTTYIGGGMGGQYGTTGGYGGSGGQIVGYYQGKPIIHT